MSLNRSKNITKEQKERLIEILDEEVDLANDRFVGIDGRNTNRESWLRVANDLNSLGGAQKDADKWRRAWNDMKKYVRAQVNALKEYDNRTGIGFQSSSRRPTELNCLDHRILNIITPEICDGNNNEEGGINIPTTSRHEHNVVQAGPSLSNADVLEISPAPTVDDLPSSRPMRSKRIRGSAHTRDNILKETNQIERAKLKVDEQKLELERLKINALNRIATAYEDRNKILSEYLLNKKINNTVDNAISTGENEEYLEEYLEII